MKLNKETPFEEYDVYENIVGQNGRKSVVLFKDGKAVKHILYSKYLMSIKENRILDASEEVDHIDNDKNNDDISNLQIISQDMNILKEKYDNNKITIYSAFVCPICGKTFSRENRQTTLVKSYQSWDTCGSPQCIRKVQDTLPKHRIGDPNRKDEEGFDKYYLGDFKSNSDKKELEVTLDKNNVKYIKK